MLFHKRKPSLTINECLKTIGELRNDFKELQTENERLKIVNKELENDCMTCINEIHRLNHELNKTKQVYTLQIEKEKEYIHRLNKEIFTLNRALGIN